MNRLLPLLLAILIPTVGHTQQWLEEANPDDNKILIQLTTAADGTPIEGATVTNITLHYFKNGTFSETEACAASATDHDCTEQANTNGAYMLEVSADKADTPGVLRVCVDYTATQAVSYCETVTVLSTESWAVLIDGAVSTDAATADAVWDEARSGHVAAGSFGQGVASVQGNITGSVASVSGNVDGSVGSLTGHTVQTGDSFARLGAPAGASVSADLVVIDNFVDDLESRLGTPANLGGGATVAFNLSDIEAQTDDIGIAGAGLTNVDLPNQTMDIIGNITGNLSGSVGSLVGHTVQTGDSFARLGAPLGASVSADVRTLYTVQADTAFPWWFGPFRSNVNHVTKATAAAGAPTCTRAIDGGAWTNADNAEGTIDAQGWSSLTISATETGATSTIRFSCALTGFDDVDVIFHIQR